MTLVKLLWEERFTIVVAVIVYIGSRLAWYYATKWSGHKKRKNPLPTEWEEVGTVSQLLIHPVKSAKSIPVDSAEATESGLACGNLVDRSFMLITENGSLVSGRQVHKLVTMATAFENNNLTIKSMNGESVTVNINEISNKNKKITKFKLRGDPVQGIDCGDEAAEWLTKRLYEDGTKIRLIYVGPEKWARPPRQLDYFTFPKFENHDTTLFVDATSYMVMTESSLQDLNEKITDPVTMKFFRPPIVVGGTVPFDEDNWEYIKIGEKVVLHMAKPCERCVMTTLDPDSGDDKKGKEQFKALLRYRVPKYPSELAKMWKEKPIFGLHCGIDVTGKINVGDKVYVTRAQSPYWHV